MATKDNGKQGRNNPTNRSHHSGDDVSREQQAAIRFMGALRAAGLDGTGKNAVDDGMLVSSLAAAGLIGIKQQTLALWRCERRRALPYIKIGRRIHYRLGVIRQFIATQEHHPTPAPR